MIRTIEAINLTIDLAESAQDENLEDGYLEYALDQTINRITMHAEHLGNNSAALITEAERLQIDVENAVDGRL